MGGLFTVKAYGDRADRGIIPNRLARIARQPRWHIHSHNRQARSGNGLEHLHQARFQRLGQASAKNGIDHQINPTQR